MSGLARRYITTFAQLVAVGFALHGIDLVYGPAAFIIGGVFFVVSIELNAKVR